MYTKLSVFDFDGTLVDTPVPSQENKDKWAEYHGKEWPFIGWWGRKESLDMDVWDMPLIPDTIRDYKKEKSNKDTMVIMLTGRLAKQKPDVMPIINKYGLEFDEYLFKRGGETSDDKIQQLNHILSKYPTITSVEMWDDRDEHIPKFEAWGNSLMSDGIEFKINHVPGYDHDDNHK